MFNLEYWWKPGNQKWATAGGHLEGGDYYTPGQSRVEKGHWGGVSNPETGGEWGKERLEGGSTNMEGT